MIIHLFRHGIAIDRAAPECPEDPQRFLTKRGVKRTRAAARGLAHLGIGAEMVLSSPFLRARETATFAMEELGIDAPLRITESLLWDADPELLRQELTLLDDKESVLCAGHAPHLDLFISYILGTPMPGTELKKAGFAVLHSDLAEPGDGTLLALYPPRTLRTLSKGS